MYKLMVVDDELESRSTLCNCFPWNDVGFEIVMQAENGLKALEFFENNPVDVVLCDIRMPIMTGIEMAVKLRSQNPNLHIIFMSGYRDFEYAHKAISLGVTGYIVKPASYKELMSLFSELKKSLDQSRQAAVDKSPRISAGSLSESANIQDKIVDTVKKYVDEHFREAILEEAANLVHMSPNYLGQIFRNKTGQNFSDYLMKVRMEKSAGLLQDITLKTYEVSECVGYSNSKNFTRAFKSYFGKTPREFRNLPQEMEE